VPPSESLTDPAPAPPLPATETTPSPSPTLPSANGDEEAALSHLEDDGGASSPTGVDPVPPTAPSLEERVRRLEDAVTLLQDRRPPEARPLPPPAPTAIRLNVAKLPPRPAAPVATVVPASAPGIVSSGTRGGILGFLWDTWAEMRAIVRMFVDPRHNLPWSARVLPLVLLAAILTSKFWVPFSSVPFLGDWLLVKLVDLLLAFLLFKWLGHEARRYRQTSPDLPAGLRL
jgi:hypothetical protein